MMESEVWASRWDELRLYLHRQLWRPLRGMMNIFHVLPLAAVVILFVFLATDGQFREIYIAALEGARNHTRAWTVSIVMAFAALTLISAVLYEAHNALSTMRINVIYSSYSDPTAGSNLRGLQRAAAFVLAFLPWVGLSVGLFGAREFVADRYCHLLNSAGISGDALESMQYLPVYGGYRIACAVVLLGLAVAYFSSIGEQHRTAQRAVACTAVPAVTAVGRVPMAPAALKIMVGAVTEPEVMLPDPVAVSKKVVPALSLMVATLVKLGRETSPELVT